MRGTKVAEVAVGADQAAINVSVPAFPPAGHAQHAMVLVLADGSDGSIRDFANFPQPECFAQPCIQGTAGFTLALTWSARSEDEPAQRWLREVVAAAAAET